MDSLGASRLSQINMDGNRFCGPSVISAIAGISTDEAAALLTSITGRHKITYAYMDDLIKAFEQLDYVAAKLPAMGSVFTMMYTMNGKDGYYVFLIAGTSKHMGHFVAIEVNGNHRYICDNHTKEPINVGNSARLSSRVLGMIKVTRKQ